MQSRKKPLPLCCFQDKSRSFCWLLHVLLNVCSVLVLTVGTVPSDCKPLRWSPHHDDGQNWLTHPWADRLCGRHFNGLEGANIKGFTLDHVTVFTTPGLRFRQDSHSILNHWFKSHTDCDFGEFGKHHESTKVKDYTQVLRTKRNMMNKSKLGCSFKILNSVPESKLCIDESLTPFSISQSIELGEYLAKSYFKKFKLLSSTSDLLEVAHSVGDEVLFQTVNAVLYGLTTEKQFIKSRVKKVPYSTVFGSQHKDQMHHLIQKSFHGEHTIFKENTRTSDREWIDSEFGSDLSVKDILSFLSIVQCNSEKPSVSQLGISLSHSQLDYLLSASDSHLQYLSNFSYFHNYAKSVTSSMFEILSQWLKSPHQFDSFKLLSVNDIFMLSLVNTFKISKLHHISPKSRLVIEKFHFEAAAKAKHKKIVEESDGELEQSYIRVLYNGDLITQDIEHCKSDSMISLGLCSFDNFLLGFMQD